ncbi:protein-L-isoaspartate O-methyltransferase [Bradyrhizobium sp. WSM1743]|uniref:protein-L-isoaspartate O-methyltransferase family protein n=1 Tax=Bradyrhizobium sp. WSM1743 TaxID=318996 RepID=UPI0006869B74|nr:hypothetical protein [Bradyrhizobium sp. WSM1743]
MGSGADLLGESRHPPFASRSKSLASEFQPYIVARMLEAAAIAKSDWVLEIGAGSGYQAGLAAKLGREVCALERHEAFGGARPVAPSVSRLPQCGSASRQRDRSMAGRRRVRVILVSAAGAQTPAVLKTQLTPLGRLLIPLGDPGGVQWLTKLTSEPDGSFIEERIEEVRFVPLISG